MLSLISLLPASSTPQMQGMVTLYPIHPSPPPNRLSLLPCPNTFGRSTDLLPPRAHPKANHLFTSMESPPDGYRTNVGICLVNPSSMIFSASRLDIPGTWQMPQGGVDEGEDPRNAVIRELREETGVTSAEILAEVPHWLTYDFPPEVKTKLNKRWGTNWKGQAQKWFLLKFTGKDEEINLAGDGSEEPEFAEWSWMTPQQVIEQAVVFKKPVYTEVLKVFALIYLQSHLQNHRPNFRCSCCILAQAPVLVQQWHIK